MSANVPVLHIYQSCSDQLIWAGMGEPVAPLIPSIESVMRIKRVPPELREEILEQVLLVFRIILMKRQKEKPKDAARKR